MLRNLCFVILGLALTLFMLRIRTNNEKPTFPPHDFTLGANLFYGRTDLHLEAVNNPASLGIIGRKFQENPVSGQYANSVQLHASGRAAKHFFPLVNLNPKEGSRQSFCNHAFLSDKVFFLRHSMREARKFKEILPLAQEKWLVPRTRGENCSKTKGVRIV